MYDALEAILIKYLKPELIRQETDTDKEEDDTDKPVVIAISSSADKLRKIKSLLGDSYKGVFVKDTASAEKYLSKQKNDN